MPRQQVAQCALTCKAKLAPMSSQGKVLLLLVFSAKQILKKINKKKLVLESFHLQKDSRLTDLKEHLHVDKRSKHIWKCMWFFWCFFPKYLCLCRPVQVGLQSSGGDGGAGKLHKRWQLMYSTWDVDWSNIILIFFYPFLSHILKFL